MKVKKWEEQLVKMSDYDKEYLVVGIEDGWLIPNNDAWHMYCKLTGVDECPILTWLKKRILKIFKRESED